FYLASLFSLIVIFSSKLLIESISKISVYTLKFSASFHINKLDSQILQAHSLKPIVELSYIRQTGLIYSLQQQIMNLLVNAIEAIQSDGDIGISTAFCPKKYASSIEARDTGPRILPHNRDKIPTFYSSTKKHGTGLGFSLGQHVIVA